MSESALAAMSLGESRPARPRRRSRRGAWSPVAGPARAAAPEQRRAPCRAAAAAACPRPNAPRVRLGGRPRPPPRPHRAAPSAAATRSPPRRRAPRRRTGPFRSRSRSGAAPPRHASHRSARCAACAEAIQHPCGPRPAPYAAARSRSWSAPARPPAPRAAAPARAGPPRRRARRPRAGPPRPRRRRASPSRPDAVRRRPQPRPPGRRPRAASRLRAPRSVRAGTPSAAHRCAGGTVRRPPGPPPSRCPRTWPAWWG